MNSLMQLLNETVTITGKEEQMYAMIIDIGAFWYIRGCICYMYIHTLCAYSHAVDLENAVDLTACRGAILSFLYVNGYYIHPIPNIILKSFRE